MPTDQRVDEIVDLATILLSEYRQGTALHDLPQRDGDLEIRGDTTLVIEVDAAGNGLAGLVAALDAVQLAVDAAAVAVFYDREIPDHASQQLNYDFLRNLVREQNVSLEIVALAGGSFAVKFRAQFRNPVTRAAAIAVAVVSTAALNIIFPPLVVPALVVGGVTSVVGVAGAIQDRRAEKRRQQREALERQRQSEKEAALQRKIEADQRALEAHERTLQDLQRELDELKQSDTERREKIEEMRAQLERLEERYDAREAPVVDLEAARQAQIRRIEVEVEGPPRAA